MKTHATKPITRQVTKQAAGFTLIEVMISLLIFATGMLGVTYQMSQGIKNTVNTEVHSSVMQVALQSIEPLKNSVSDFDQFKTNLENLNTNITSPAFASGSNQENFTISIDSAEDDVIALGAANNDLLTTATTNWSPPFTVVLKISYDTGINYITGVSTLDFYTTHVLTP